MERDRDRDRRPPPSHDFPVEDQFRSGRGQSYRPGGARERSPPHRPRSPPRRADFGVADTYRGPPPGRSPPRRDGYRRRSPSPPSRYRDRDIRGADTYRTRPRSPPPRRDDLPRDDLFRRGSPRDFRDDRGYREPGDYGRNDRPRGYGGPRSPPRHRDRSPLPVKRGREPSPIGSRGRRSPPPIKRERLTSPPARPRYNDPPSARPLTSPARRYSPAPHDREMTRDNRMRSRSPPMKPDQIDSRSAEDRQRLKSPPSRPALRQETQGDESGGRGSGATSRRSSPPLHPNRVTQHTPGSDASGAPRQSQRGRDSAYHGRSQETRRPPPTAPMEYEQSEAPSQQVSDGNSAFPEQDVLSHDSTKPESTSMPVRAPPTAPAGPRGAQSAMSPPTGPSAGATPSATMSRGPSVPPSGPRGGLGSSRPDFGSARGRGGFRGDFNARAAYGAPSRGGRGGAAAGPGYGRGGAAPSAPANDRESDFQSGPPSGPRAAPLQAPSAPYRQSSSITTPAPSSRSQRFGAGGSSMPESSTRTGPRGFQRRPTEPGSITDPRPSGPHPALTGLPKRKDGGEKAPPVADRSKLDRLEEEADKLRKTIEEKETKMRRSLREWDRLARETAAASFRTQIAEEALRNVSGEAEGAAAF